LVEFFGMSPELFLSSRLKLEASTAEDLELHSASEGEAEPGDIKDYELDDEENEEDKDELEEPIVLKTWIGFVRNSDKNSPSPTPPEELAKAHNIQAEDSATGAAFSPNQRHAT
jgi:hypothetical protein